jgi:hypothetical protein
MRITEDDIQLIIQDSPGLSWLLGALFLGIGGLTAAGPLGLFEHSTDLSMGVRTLVFGLGIIGIGAGGFVVRGSPLSISVVDRHTRQITIARRNLFGGSSAQIAFSDIKKVDILQNHNPEGDPIYQIQFTLQDGRTIPVSVLWEQDRQFCERTAAEIKSWIRA